MIKIFTGCFLILGFCTGNSFAQISSFETAWKSVDIENHFKSVSAEEALEYLNQAVEASVGAESFIPVILDRSARTIISLPETPKGDLQKLLNHNLDTFLDEKSKFFYNPRARFTYRETGSAYVHLQALATYYDLYLKRSEQGFVLTNFRKIPVVRIMETPSAISPFADEILEDKLDNNLAVLYFKGRWHSSPLPFRLSPISDNKLVFIGMTKDWERLKMFSEEHPDVTGFGPNTHDSAKFIHDRQGPVFTAPMDPEEIAKAFSKVDWSEQWKWYEERYRIEEIIWKERPPPPQPFFTPFGPSVQKPGFYISHAYDHLEVVMTGPKSFSVRCSFQKIPGKYFSERVALRTYTKAGLTSDKTARIINLFMNRKIEELDLKPIPEVALSIEPFPHRSVDPVNFPLQPSESANSIGDDSKHLEEY
jgi:hypothetical protein